MIAVFGGAACVLWVAAAWWMHRNARAMPVLADQRPSDPPAWPALSVIVPACNEGDTIEAAMTSLLAADYPGLEVILVNDRSTDGTGAAVDRLAARDSRVVPVHVTALPAGWLGKVHAMEQGRRRARGAWLLFTDADVHFAPGVLKQAVALALAESAGHVAVFPDIPVHGFWLRSAVASFALSFFLVFDGRKLGRPRGGVTMGVGAFNLVRRADLDATPGWEWLRLEVIDDLGLAQMLNRAGVKGLVVIGRSLLSVEWYRSLGGMVRGLEKGAFAALGYRTGVAWGLAALTLLPLAGLAAAACGAPRPWGPAASLTAFAFYTAAGAAGLARYGARPAYALMAVPGAVINVWITLRSAVRCAGRGSVTWRGTSYPLEALRAGRRVSFF